MGYRSTFVTNDTFIPMPQWFHDRWERSCHLPKVGTKGSSCISSKYELKTYGAWQGLEQDLQRCLAEAVKSGDEPWMSHILVSWLGEDGEGGLTTIYADRIEGFFPTQCPDR
jgi:hypothetical protein